MFQSRMPDTLFRGTLLIFVRWTSFLIRISQDSDTWVLEWSQACRPISCLAYGFAPLVLIGIFDGANNVGCFSFRWLYISRIMPSHVSAVRTKSQSPPILCRPSFSWDFLPENISDHDAKRTSAESQLNRLRLPAKEISLLRQGPYLSARCKDEVLSVSCPKAVRVPLSALIPVGQ